MKCQRTSLEMSNDISGMVFELITSVSRLRVAWGRKPLLSEMGPGICQTAQGGI